MSGPFHIAESLGYPLLWALQLLPLVGALAVYLLRTHVRAVILSRIVALLEMALAIELLLRVDARSASLQLTEQVSLFGVPIYHVGADGITVLFVLLNAALTVLLSFYGLVQGMTTAGRISVLILSAEALLMSMLVTLNVLWFAIASYAELMVVAYLLGHWSTSSEENRALAMARFMQFQTVGAALLFISIGILGWNYADITGQWSFDLNDLLRTPLSGKFQTVAFFLMFYGLAIRTPLFPLHGWLPHVAQRGMVAVAPALLLGIKVGIYGMIRFMLPLLPNAILAWQPWVVGIAMAGVFYTAILALLQTNLRRLLAFAVVSHTSLIVIGLFTLEAVGLQGAVLLTINFGLAVTVMLFAVGFVFRRTRSSDFSQLGGLFERIPFVGGVFLVGGLSIIGMPGTPGFDAAHLVLEAAIDRFGALPSIATALGNVASAGFLLWGFQRTFLAPRIDGQRSHVPLTEPIEYFVGGAAAALLLFAGFYSEPWLYLTDAPVKALGARFSHGG